PLDTQVLFEKIDAKGYKNISQIPDKNRQQEDDSISENCSFQSQSLATNINSTFLFKIKVEDKPVLLQITGNTVLSREEIINSDEIQSVMQRIEGQNLTSEQFEEIYTEIVNAITQVYIKEGYITSKAIRQELLTINEDDAIEIPVSEGRLEEINIAGRRRLTLSYLCNRIALGISSPFNIIKLEEQLRLLQRNPLLKTVQASLKDSGKPSFSILLVSIQEAKPFSSNLSVDNYSPPSIGSERLGIELRYRNVTGLGDEISGVYYHSTTGGANILDIIYRIPLNPMEGMLQLRATPNWTKITESSLEKFNITGNEQVYEISYRQPLVRTLQEEFALSLGFRYQDGRTFVFDQPVFFGHSRTSVIQFGQDYIHRDTEGIWFLRSQFNFGTGLFNPTTNE
ncbi:MAG: ShlB/FhaC/HecB family hemolysin secretion/activation protein, partial [Microcystaceae cyanobacterium]